MCVCEILYRAICQKCLFLLFTLLLGVHSHLAQSRLCTGPTKGGMSGLVKNGEIMFGSLMPLHFGISGEEQPSTKLPQIPGCIHFLPRAFRWAIAVMFAVNEINHNDDLLPNITLGYFIGDSCFGVPQTVQASLHFMDPTSEIDEACNYFSATCKCLSDKKQFPSYLRTDPSDVHQASAIVHLVQHFSWIYMGVLGVDDDYGLKGVTQFIIESEKNGLCIAFNDKIPKITDSNAHRNLAEIVQMTKAKVILLYTNDIDLIPFVEEALHQNVTGKIWISSEGWATSPVLSTPQYAHILHGSMGFALRSGSVPGLSDMLMSLQPKITQKNNSFQLQDTNINSELIQETFTNVTSPFGNDIKIDNPLRSCSGNERLQEAETSFTDDSQLRKTYVAYVAVYAVAHALHDMQACVTGNGPFHNNSCVNTNNSEHWQVLFYLRKLLFYNNRGEPVTFDENGDPIAVYDLIQWQKIGDGRIHFVKVGGYDSSASADQYLKIDSVIIWGSPKHEVPQSLCSESCRPGTRRLPLRGEPFCCFECVPCNAGEFSNDTDSEDCVHCQNEFWSNAEHTGCVQMPEEYLAFSDPLSIALLAFASMGVVTVIIIGLIMFLHRKLPILQKTNHYEIGILLIISIMTLISCVLFVGRPAQLVCQMHEAVSCFCLAISKWIFIGIITVLQIIFHTTWALIGHPDAIRNTQTKQGVIILECGGSSSAFSIGSIANLGILVLICLILALKGHKSSVAENETKFIIFSMTYCVLVGLTFVPAYVSTQGKYNVATEIFAIIATVHGLLGCIFVPKCYTVLSKWKEIVHFDCNPSRGTTHEGGGGKCIFYHEVNGNERYILIATQAEVQPMR
uniref:G-protein coupled receptors family 3 profile domain-containing protein n=1 Tax=Eptatretus burgeri TaxID=7764 RepID=A0A8C4Q5Z2_EPTBU